MFFSVTEATSKQKKKKAYQNVKMLFLEQVKEGAAVLWGVDQKDAMEQIFIFLINISR